jgi:hypothetical protein
MSTDVGWIPDNIRPTGPIQTAIAWCYDLPPVIPVYEVVFTHEDDALDSDDITFTEWCEYSDWLDDWLDDQLSGVEVIQ